MTDSVANLRFALLNTVFKSCARSQYQTRIISLQNVDRRNQNKSALVSLEGLRYVSHQQFALLAFLTGCVFLVPSHNGFANMLYLNTCQVVYVTERIIVQTTFDGIHMTKHQVGNARENVVMTCSYDVYCQARCKSCIRAALEGHEQLVAAATWLFFW